MGFADIAKQTRNPKESLTDEYKKKILQSNKEKESLQRAKKILICGENGTGKTTLAIDLLCYDMKDDEFIVYIDVDGSGAEIITTFFEDMWINDSIKHLDTYAGKNININGKEVEVKDEEMIVANTIAISSAIKELIEEGFKIKGVIIDGVSFILEFCEAKMRLDKGLTADQGTKTQIWKLRSKYFREFTSPYMALPIHVIFISHDDFIHKPDDEHKLSAVKQRLIDECSVRMETYKEESSNLIDYYTEIKKDRAASFNVGKKINFLSVRTDDDIIEQENVTTDDTADNSIDGVAERIFFEFTKSPSSKEKSDKEWMKDSNSNTTEKKIN